MIQLDSHRIVHLAAGLGVGVKDQRDGRILRLALGVSPLDPPGCARQNHLWHAILLCRRILDYGTWSS